MKYEECSIVGCQPFGPVDVHRRFGDTFCLRLHVLDSFFDSEIGGSMYLRNVGSIGHIYKMHKIQKLNQHQKGPVTGSVLEVLASFLGGHTLVASLLSYCVQSVPCLVRARSLPPTSPRDERGQVPLSYSLFLHSLNINNA
jgi:hypothetical protein